MAFAIPFALNMCLGVCGNALVITVVRRSRAMHTTTNFLLVNLAVGDIMILIWNPRWISFVIYPVHPRGTPGDLVCVLYTGNAIITVVVSASILTLVVLAVERYNALVNAMKGVRISTERLPFVIGGIWGLAVAVSIPDFLNNYFSTQYKKCLCPFSLELASKLSIHIYCTITLLGILPFLILSFCYFQILKGVFITNTICAEQSVPSTADDAIRRKLAKLCLSVTCAFYICYLPYATFLLFIASVEKGVLIQRQDMFTAMLRACEFFVTLSSSLNPVIYAFQSTSYRQGFKEI
ncbi:predicted protein, partial [Nematostella vectensis]